LPDSEVCGALALSGRLDLLQESRRRGFPWARNVCTWAASRGHLELLEWAVAHGCSWDPVLVCEWAASMEGWKEQYGYALGLRYCHERSLEILRWVVNTSGRTVADLSKSPGSNAVAGGMLSTILERAVSFGNVLAVRWLHDNGGWVNFNIGTMWRNAVSAPEGVVLDTVQCLRELGLPWDAQACASAAGPDQGMRFHRSNLDLLQYLRRHGCPWDERTCTNAARAGDLETLRFARHNGCHWDGGTIAGAVLMIGTEYEHAGHHEILLWALDQGCPVTDYASMCAARNGNIELLTMLVERHAPLTEECCAEAAWGGHLDCLKWLRGRGCRWDENTWTNAAVPSEGQLLPEDCATWASEIEIYGEPQLHILRYLFEEGCPCNLDETWYLLEKLVTCGWIRNPQSQSMTSTS